VRGRAAECELRWFGLDFSAALGVVLFFGLSGFLRLLQLVKHAHLEPKFVVS
jgi:hypothetical protein